MSFGSAGVQQLGPLLMRRWEHFSSRLAPHFPTMGLPGLQQMHCGSWGAQVRTGVRHLGYLPSQLAPAGTPSAPSGQSALSLSSPWSRGRRREKAEWCWWGWGEHVKGRPGTSSLTGHPCHDMTWPLGDLPAVSGRSNVVQPWPF